jgi:CRP/FNR family transcriptional regulator, anaerobic regulatory protein
MMPGVPENIGHKVNEPRDNSVIDLRSFSLSVSSFLPATGVVMLDQTFTLTRSHRDPATLPADFLAPSTFSGTHLGRPTLQALFLSQVAETVVPPRAILWEGDAAGHVFLVLEGCLRTYRVGQDGRRTLLGFSYPGDLLGVSSFDVYTFTAEAVTPVRLKRLARRRFNELVDDSQDLRSERLTAICSEMTAAQDQITRLGRTAADERVASFLLDVARRTDADAVTPGEIDLPFGRVDIADYLGLTVETVSREISKLKRDGLISLRGPHKIILRRLGRLRERARMDVDEPGEVRETGARSRLVNAPSAGSAAFSM